MQKLFVLLSTAVVLAGSVLAKPCANPTLQWELRTTYTVEELVFTSRIVPGDAKGTYKNGTDGVQAVLNSCSGSYDATLQTGAKRKILFDFGPSVGGASITWPAVGAAFLNLRNLRRIDASLEGEFTTWLGSSIPSPGGTSYNFRMFNPVADVTGTFITPEELAATNSPIVTSKVTVYHCPAGNTHPAGSRCEGLTRETWFVYPDPTPTPYSTGGTTSPFINVGSAPGIGEFEMPFSFVISIQ